MSQAQQTPEPKSPGPIIVVPAALARKEFAAAHPSALLTPAPRVADRQWRNVHDDGTPIKGSARTILNRYIKPYIESSVRPLHFPLFAPELIQLMLDRQGITSEAFSEKLGYEKSYFTGVFNSFNNACELRVPFQEKLAAITNTPLAFWQQVNYRAEDYDRLTIDMDKDVSAVVAKHAPRSDIIRAVHARRHEEKANRETPSLPHSSPPNPGATR